MTGSDEWEEIRISIVLDERIKKLRARFERLLSTPLTTEDVIVLLLGHAERFPEHIVGETGKPPSDERLRRALDLPISTGRRTREEDIDDDLNEF